MKQPSLRNSLMGFVVLMLAVLGCSRNSINVSKNEQGAATTGPAAHSEPAATDISGNYTVAGTNENGTPYSGALEVIKRGDVYQFRWTAGRQYDGVGIPQGNVVAVAFTEGSDGKGCGVVSYRIEDDGNLDGKWGYWGVNQSGTEKATRNSGSGLAGEYSTVGTNPDGKEYKGSLSIAAKGSGYTFSWADGSTGYGIERNKNISVGIGGAKCAFVAYEIKSDGVMDGVWGGYGSEKTGTEKATKK